MLRINKLDNNYKFYGHEVNIKAKSENNSFRGTPRELYDILTGIWCEYTCAPRLRAKWSPSNKTLGQCSITAFLAQDLFGGKVFGVELPDGNYHCYNSVENQIFDLTSEQFPDIVLPYDNSPEQFREIHFASEEKQKRYNYLKQKLEEQLR